MWNNSFSRKRSELDEATARRCEFHVEEVACARVCLCVCLWGCVCVLKKFEKIKSPASELYLFPVLYDAVHRVFVRSVPSNNWFQVSFVSQNAPRLRFPGVQNRSYKSIRSSTLKDIRQHRHSSRETVDSVVRFAIHPFSVN